MTLDMAKSFLRVSTSAEDGFIGQLITAAREEGENLSFRALAQRTFTQVLDSHPYYTDTIQSQSAFPPSYYSLPRYSTTLWNYSQMIKLFYPPCKSVDRMRYIGTDGVAHLLVQDVDFILDRISEPARIFPLPGQFWPADLYVANSLEIDFTAGYDPDPTVVDVHVVSPPQNPPSQQPDSTIVLGVRAKVILGILNLVAYWFNNRGQAGNVPDRIADIFRSEAVLDFAPTRG